MALAFVTLGAEGVGEFMRIGTRAGRRIRSGLEVGPAG